ncbi:energy transducer TonB [Kordiimonas sp. SCSIO 12603]|uniref:energy transducer TonB n=1 Tax=Kordiimonas sp. SCSIO 12603 TaxID=2829596 RepID=UPI002102E3FF|nr:energy transducer TonB [Kordiimonas sp. SCSIO 12603]UTW58532.1 energy transducer TonB [Kordiimonas sp. SCSIO 12603]
MHVFIRFTFIAVVLAAFANAEAGQAIPNNVGDSGANTEEQKITYKRRAGPVPQFPRKALDAKIKKAEVLVRFSITPKGVTKGCEILEVSRSGYGFEEETCRVVKYTLYTPPKDQAGNIVEVKVVELRFDYKL